MTCPPDPPACEHGVPYYPTGGMSPRCAKCPNGKPGPRPKTTDEPIAIDWSIEYFDTEAKEWKELPINTGTDIRMAVWGAGEKIDSNESHLVFQGKVDDFNVKSDKGKPSALTIKCQGVGDDTRKRFEILENNGSLQEFVNELASDAGIPKEDTVQLIDITEAYKRAEAKGISMEQLMGTKPMPGTTAEASMKLRKEFFKLGRACEAALPYWLRPTVIVKLLDKLIGKRSKNK